MTGANDATDRAVGPPAVVFGGAEKEGGGYQMGKVPAIEDYRAVIAQRAVFQSIASMGLPAFTIHSIVRYSGRALKDVKNTRIRVYGPIGVSFLFPLCLRRSLPHIADPVREFLSLVWPLSRFCRSCSTSQLRKRLSGRFIRLSRF